MDCISLVRDITNFLQHILCSLKYGTVFFLLNESWSRVVHLKDNIPKQSGHTNEFLVIQKVKLNFSWWTFILNLQAKSKLFDANDVRIKSRSQAT